MLELFPGSPEIFLGSSICLYPLTSLLSSRLLANGHRSSRTTVNPWCVVKVDTRSAFRPPRFMNVSMDEEQVDVRDPMCA